ncbi:hypothetical protein K469DRAFT_749330 [Zopfia rhizophila CBS 207.26]|uniref:Telomere length regulation protein conserved domain-containing protein n=1 Tax=Zopfia rhizophila CBS 207.26 TaxID=1314779 RepID=A0A6A6E7B7_9PEZI|nr:hypothetical protein K469DRAFT_749330 [Zopfia rhizophila CBS 207.26]
MNDLLTPVSTIKVKPSQPSEARIGLSPRSATTTKDDYCLFESPETALKALKDQPDLETVETILSYLLNDSHKKDGFNLVIPGPLSAQIVDTLVTTTIPDYWRAFKSSGRNGKRLVQCLQNVSGIGAIMSRLRPLIADCRHKKSIEQTRDPSEHIEDLLDILSQISKDDHTSSQIWNGIQAHAQNPTQKKLTWKEYLSQTASGRILSVVAQAENALKERGLPRKESWLANGNEYASWLGRNIATIMEENQGAEESVSSVTELCGRSLALGYTDRIVTSITDSMVNAESTKIFEEFLRKMKAHEQRQYLNAIISCIAKHYFGSVVETRQDVPLNSLPTISGAAALVHGLIKKNEPLKDHMVSVLTKSTISSLDDSLAARRSVIAALTQDSEKLQNIIEKSLRLFGDSFYIVHTPLLQQEALAQTLAISCGYVHRSEPMFLSMMAKSSYHVTAMSNRIGASSPRARFLGMAVGMAISQMVDKPELQLKFDLEGNEAAEAKWYQHLTRVEDQIGKVHDLKPQTNSSSTAAKKTGGKAALPKQKSNEPKGSAITEITGPRVVEILDDSSEDDDDLTPYAKPDSDPEDDTDDPTMIDRNKPTAPVYIRDLIAGLRDQGNYDRHQLALSTAAPLIRRKANFGTEVADHIEELASILVNLNDDFNMPNFAEERLEALIAVLLAKSGPMAQWFARSFFSGDYSLTQRVAMLTTLGLGARELAGLKDSTTEDQIPPTPDFPSKTLPPNLHRIYGNKTDPVGKITSRLSKQMLEPMAATAADKLSGPDILKVRTFSSRMEVEKKRKKPIPNKLAQIVADNFFFPLTGRWWVNTQSTSFGSENLYTSPQLLPPYLQTLAILMNASGPNTLALPQMTREFWDLLLSVRGIAPQDKTILSALLFALLMLLETNENKERLANEQAKELLETQEWVRRVFEGLSGGGEEDEKVRVQAAGVLIRCQEVVEKYQRRMAGSMMDY